MEMVFFVAEIYCERGVLLFMWMRPVYAPLSRRDMKKKSPSIFLTALIEASSRNGIFRCGDILQGRGAVPRSRCDMKKSPSFLLIGLMEASFGNPWSFSLCRTCTKSY